MSDLELTMMRRVGELKAENARLKAEVERLTALVESNLNQSKRAMANSDASVRTLEAQVERLTKAGDAMVDMVDWEVPYERRKKLEADWNAAKEGKGQP
jgi:predicted phage gp36 major capsid-like protein